MAPWHRRTIGGGSQIKPPETTGCSTVYVWYEPSNFWGYPILNYLHLDTRKWCQTATGYLYCACVEQKVWAMFTINDPKRRAGNLGPMLNDIETTTTQFQLLNAWLNVECLIISGSLDPRYPRSAVSKKTTLRSNHESPRKNTWNILERISSNGTLCFPWAKSNIGFMLTPGSIHCT